MIPAVLERCAGIDVGKEFLVACLMVGAPEEKPTTEIRQFNTTMAELYALHEWLVQNRCTHVVMESTGSYWKPIFNVLETSINVVLVNARDRTPGSVLRRNGRSPLGPALRLTFYKKDDPVPPAVRSDTTVPLAAPVACAGPSPCPDSNAETFLIGNDFRPSLLGGDPEFHEPPTLMHER